jgi:hypothetical protein
MYHLQGRKKKLSFIKKKKKFKKKSTHPDNGSAKVQISDMASRSSLSKE